MAKKKADRPKRVSIYFDRLSIQLGFMSTEQAGYLFNLIVYYSMGVDDKVNELLTHLTRTGGNEIVLMAFQENKVAIDEDLANYAEVCEKRRYAVAKREEYKRERELSNDNKCNQVISNDSNTNTITNTSTNTITNTNSPNGEVCVCSSDADAPHTPHTKSVEERRKDTYNKVCNRIRDKYPQVARLIMPAIDTLNNMLKDVQGDWALFWDLIAQMENNPKLLEHNRYLSRAFKSYLANNK